MSYDMRPLSLAELLDRAFGLYRRHFILFVGIMAIPSITMLVFSVGVQFLESSPPVTAPGEEPDPAKVVGAAAGIAAGFIGMMILYWITYAVALGATTTAVSEIYKGQIPSIAEAYSSIRGKVGRLALLMLLVGLRITGALLVIGILAGIMVPTAIVFAPLVGGLLALGVFGVGVILCGWMVLRYAVSVPPAVLEDSSASESIARSIELTRGSLWRVLAIVVFTVIIAYAGLMLFQLPFVVAAQMAGPQTTTGFWLNLTGVVSGSIASALTSPLAIVAMAVLYYDLRIRKEGLDVELLIAGLRPEPPSPAVLPG